MHWVVELHDTALKAPAGGPVGFGFDATDQLGTALAGDRPVTPLATINISATNVWMRRRTVTPVPT
jgi:hypothetical protein